MKLIGEITEQCQKTVADLQLNQDLILKEIGKLEYQKDLMLNQVKELQATIQKLLNQEVSALGVPKGAEWEIAKDRKVYVAEVGD
tara:strand:+ start:17 stop:271 length:255 start_codon:yes stop_codon:yes gene_type:complete